MGTPSIWERWGGGMLCSSALWSCGTEEQNDFGRGTVAYLTMVKRGEGLACACDGWPPACPSFA